MRSFVRITILALALSGCEKLDQHRATRAMERAEQRAAEGDITAAVKFYEEALDGTPATAEIHYKLALIYDDRLKKPVSALHHFQRYVDLAPSGAHASEAEDFMREGRLRAMMNLSSGPLLSQQEAVRLRNENLELRKQAAALRDQVDTLRKTRPIPVKKAERLLESPPPGTRTYVVEPGDTLAAISRKFFDTSARWKDIQDANFNQLEGGVALKPGMKLIIPE